MPIGLFVMAYSWIALASTGGGFADLAFAVAMVRGDLSIAQEFDE